MTWAVLGAAGLSGISRHTGTLDANTMSCQTWMQAGSTLLALTAADQAPVTLSQSQTRHVCRAGILVIDRRARPAALRNQPGKQTRGARWTEGEEKKNLDAGREKATRPSIGDNSDGEPGHAVYWVQSSLTDYRGKASVHDRRQQIQCRFRPASPVQEVPKLRSRSTLFGKQTL